MRRISRVMIAAALPLVAGATAARAQLAGIPVSFNPAGGTGIGVAANVGFPNSNYLGTGSGGGTAYGVEGSLGLSALTVRAMVGAWKPKGFAAGVTTYGGDVGYRVFGGGLLPVAVGVQAGYGAVKDLVLGETQSTIPIGIGVALNPPLFPIKPWIAPRIELTHVSGGGATSTTATAFRISAGVNFNLLLGLGVHAVVDWGKVSSKLDPATPSSLTWGVGGHFNFHVPMM
jgi:hypothetical protein